MYVYIHGIVSKMVNYCKLNNSSEKDSCSDLYNFSGDFHS